MIWGTNVAPYALQDFMEAVTEAISKKLLHQGIEAHLFCYQDDLCISAKTREKCWQAAKFTLKTFEQAGLVIS